MKIDEGITIVSRKVLRREKRVDAVDLPFPHRVDVIPGERSPHSFPESCAQQFLKENG